MEDSIVLMSSLVNNSHYYYYYYYYCYYYYRLCVKPMTPAEVGTVITYSSYNMTIISVRQQAHLLAKYISKIIPKYYCVANASR